MNETEDQIIARAAAWHVASHGDDMDWDGFTSWLEADPRHRAAYDEVALTDAALIEHRAQLAAAFDNRDDAAERPDGRRRWLPWGGAAIAASLVAALLVQQVAVPGSQVYATDARGRSIALADGSRVELAPRSRLEVSEGGERLALDGGAWFAIRHDPARALVVEAGALEITDIGTRFDVQAAQGQVRVEVAEGTVKASAAVLGAPIRLEQGQSLAFDGQARTAVVRPVGSGNIGEWRSGRLSFDDAQLTLVAADLARYAGVRVTVADQIAARRFTGTLVVGDGQAALRDLSQLMDLELARSGDGFRLEPR